MVVLFDYDSLLYKAVYKIVSVATIRAWIKSERSREWMEQEILNLAINRLEALGNNLFIEIENLGIDILFVEYYITYTTNPYRKKIAPTYKKGRIKNKWVRFLREYLITTDFAISDPCFEADDLIADRARTLGNGNYIVLSTDKDLKTIPGLHYDYYRKPSKIKSIKNDCRGLLVLTEREAEYNFWRQMLTGDTVDVVKGVPGIGGNTADKILMSAEDLKKAVTAVYFKKYEDSWKTHFYINYQLLYLGTDRNNLIY